MWFCTILAKFCRITLPHYIRFTDHIKLNWASCIIQSIQWINEKNMQHIFYCFLTQEQSALRWAVLIYTEPRIHTTHAIKALLGLTGFQFSAKCIIEPCSHKQFLLWFLWKLSDMCAVYFRSLSMLFLPRWLYSENPSKIDVNIISYFARVKQASEVFCK